jgi:hypothetical protein
VKHNITGTEYASSSGRFVEFDIVTFPVIVVFPVIAGFEIIVYDQHHDVVARSTESDHSLAVYFSTAAAAMGRIFVSSVSEAKFEYLAVAWPGWTCSEFFVSTSRLETFTGSNSTEDHANVTLANSQDICMFELSSSDIDISGRYSTDVGFDILRCGNLSTTKNYTGEGTFADSLAHFASVWWHSDPNWVSASFSIGFVSGGSTFPTNRWRCNVTSHSPQVLTNEVTYETPGKSRSMALILSLAIGLPVLAAIVVGVVFKCNRKRKSWKTLDESIDIDGPLSKEVAQDL